jgi:hypothetical protein
MDLGNACGSGVSSTRTRMYITFQGGSFPRQDEYPQVITR